ncbi:MAG: hypothetical protein M1819_001265 [Sarea resinae]|nr:MAG: hypothetical protein M1819_001265 [Sarea resinae]
MGFNMAKNLRAKIPAEDTLTIYDLNADTTSRFVKEVGIAASSAGVSGKGTAIEVAESPREVAEKSETIITVLPESSHVKSAFWSILEHELPTEGLSEDRLFIDCSTIDPASSREVANAVHSASRGKFVDAPMSGGVVGAKAGTLTFMLGAPECLIDRVNPVLSLMGSRILHLGPQGAGLSGKLANNYLLALTNIATAEAMNLGIKLGLEPKALGAMINVCTGRSWSSEVNNPVPGVLEGSPASRGYEGGFGVSLMKKDLNLAIAAAAEADVRLELAEVARLVYEAVEKDEQCKGKDFSVVYRYLGGA